MPEDQFAQTVSNQLKSLGDQFAEQRKDLTELRVAFAAMKATVDAQQQMAHAEIGNLKEARAQGSDASWKWIGVIFTLIGLLAGVVYAIVKK